jgi:hypothetical protein
MDCCGPRKKPQAAGPKSGTATPNSQQESNWLTDLFTGSKGPPKLKPGQLVISDAAYKGDLNQVGIFQSNTIM